MEALLFVVILILLFSNNSKINSLNKKVTELLGKLDELSFSKTEKQTQKSSIKKAIERPAVIKEVVPSKIEAVKPLVVPVEKVQPIIKKDAEVIKKTVKEIVPVTPEIKKKTKKQKSLDQLISDKIAQFRKNNPDIEKFVGENLISKIGILILVLGISFFVKFAIDQNWINEVARVGIGFLSGAILLGFAHRLQKDYKAFSSILVSGAIVVFYFIIAYAFKEYELFSQTVAFVLMVLITIFSVAISILYDRKELGILSLIGGFAVPVLASNGSGNFIVLFTYLLILNIGFLVVSINRKWLVINILAFIFTHIFFVGWLIDDINIQENAPILFLFASLFYLVFYMMNIVRVAKEKEHSLKPLVMSLFLISTFVYYGQGLFLLDMFAPALKGAFTLLLAVINLGTGWALLQKNIIDKKTIYLFVGMTLTFLTLTGPIQLEGNYITLFWAAEGVLLIWLSQKIKNNDFKIAAFITLLLMLGSLFMDFEQIYLMSDELPVIFNKGFLTGMFSAASLGITAFLLFKEKGIYKIRNTDFNPSKVAISIIIVAGVVLYLTGLLELTHQTEKYFDHYLAITITTIYNYVFVLIGIFYLLKTDNKKWHSVGLLVSVIAILYGIFFVSELPFSAYISTKIDAIANPSFYIQFILLVMIFAIMRILYIHGVEQQINNKKYVYLSYFIATAFVTLVSLELLIISKPVTVDSQLIGLPDISNAIYSIVYQSQITVIKTSFPILWGILAFVFLYFGIKNSKQEWRVFSLILIAVTVVKLFTYDIGNVSQGGKIMAFIILGVVLLVISFMYQRIKKAILQDDDKE